MSRYRASGDFTYAGPPPPRWDAERFTRERDFRQTEEYYQPAPPPPRRAARPVYEEERIYYEDDRYGPRGQVDRRFYEEDEYYDPRRQPGQMIPYRTARPQPPPARPGMLLRRQSSLDTFDRPGRRFDDYDDYRPPPRAPRMEIDVPHPQGPGTNRYRPARPVRPARPAYDYYEDYYDDVAIQDPDYYGDEGFREFREREWVRSRRRDSSSRSHSRSRPRDEGAEASTEVKEEVKSERTGSVRKEEVKEVVKEEVKEKPYPRRGKTRMPKRLVHTKVLFDLGYPFYEEGEKTIIIEKALGPDNIDEVFAKSKEYREKEVSTTRLIEAPPPPPSEMRSPPRSAAPRSVREDDRTETIKQTEVKTIPLSEAPRSVREWDQLSVRDDTRSVRRSEASKSTRAKSRAVSSDREETIIEKKTIIKERESSRSSSPHRRRRSRRRKSRAKRDSSNSSAEIIERRITREEDDFEVIDSDPVKIGPLALVIDSNRRNERDVKEQIRRLEAEQRALRRERRGDRVSSDFIVERRPSRSRSRSMDSHDIVIETKEDITRRRRSPSRRRLPRRSPSRGGSARRRSVSRTRDVIIERRPSPTRESREVIIEHRGDHDGEVVEEIHSNVRERSQTRTRGPSAGLLKGMFYTLT